MNKQKVVRKRKKKNQKRKKDAKSNGNMLEFQIDFGFALVKFI